MSKSAIIDAMASAGQGSISDAAAARAYGAMLNTVVANLRFRQRASVPGLGTFTTSAAGGVEFTPCRKLLAMLPSPQEHQP